MRFFICLFCLIQWNFLTSTVPIDQFFLKYFFIRGEMNMKPNFENKSLKLMFKHSNRFFFAISQRLKSLRCTQRLRNEPFFILSLQKLSIDSQRFITHNMEFILRVSTNLLSNNFRKVTYCSLSTRVNRIIRQVTFRTETPYINNCSR